MLPLLLSSLLLSPAIAAATSDKPRSLSTRGDGYIRHPVRTLRGSPNLRRRQAELETTSHLSGMTYTVDVEIGTPGQTITVILDTGSPDLWVNPTCQTAGGDQAEYCTNFAQFDWRKSSTIQDSGVANILTYGKGNVTIQYVADVVSLGGASIPQQIFGVGLESHDIPMGILGLSPSVDPTGQSNYGYVLDSLVSENLISSRAFSLDLRSIDSDSGAVIFGGVDTGKFVGALEKLPMLDPSETPVGADRYYVSLTGVGVTLPDGSSLASEPISLPVFLDSGGTFSRLPVEIFLAIGEAVPGAQYSEGDEAFLVDCAIADEPGSMDFAFGDKVISVPWKDFIFDVGGICAVGVLPEPADGEPVFGDTFLRAAYVVYDQDNRNLHIAQAANCGTNIIPIGSGPNAVPSSTGECTAADVPTATGGGGGLDVTKTRVPTNVITDGPTVTNLGFGPGPAGKGQTTTISGGLGAPTPGPSRDDDENGAGMVSVGMGAVVALLVVNAVAFML